MKDVGCKRNVDMEGKTEGRVDSRTAANMDSLP